MNEFNVFADQQIRKIVLITLVGFFICLGIGFFAVRREGNKEIKKSVLYDGIGSEMPSHYMNISKKHHVFCSNNYYPPSDFPRRLAI